MELSVDIQNPLAQFKLLKRRSEEFAFSDQVTLNSNYEIVSNSIVDVTKINFSNDETWLHESPNISGFTGVDLHKWLHETYESTKDEDSIKSSINLARDVARIDSEKSFDSRTFTRPKKRFSRPSIEKYNEELYGSDNDSSLLSSPKRVENDLSHKKQGEINVSSPTKPLSFDLAQPTTSYYFEKLASAPEIDSFQNMSPPSLVNSMCSSTFANLMESSFIKNDPLLREIRDTDYTETILLQDSEPPLFQSFTESCSSLNSDTPESFLRKVSFRKSVLKDFDEDLNNKSTRDDTFKMDSTRDSKTTGSKDTTVVIYSQINDSPEATSSPTPTVNGTYKRPSKYATYRKSDVRKDSPNLDATFQVSPSNNLKDNSQGQNTNNSSQNDTTINLNSTITIESPKLKRRFEKSLAQRREALENMKQANNETYLTETSTIGDMNRLNYIEEQEKLNITIIKDEVNQLESKQSQMKSSTGSVDSLDRLSSSLSSSSRGSPRMMNMAEVDAIVEKQEQSLHIMSTPKPNTVNKKLWENCISPITVHEPYSDSDQSSNDDFKSARSDVSKKSASETHIKNAKSLGYLPNQTVNHKSNIRSVNTVTSTRNLQSMANTFRGSYTNLRTAVNGYSGSQSNLNKISSNLKGSQSNLKTVGSVLRGSYTSLRPISSVSLPVAPPITKSHSNPTTTRPLNTNNTTRIISSHTKVAEVPPIPRETSSGDHHFVKPAPPKTSGLPRPVGTGIPRPVSRIPGPRAARPSSLYQTRHASEGYY